MKLNKSTTVLLNVVLIVAVLLLIKSFIGFPKNAYGMAVQYNVVLERGTFEFQQAVNKLSLEGWSVVGFAHDDMCYYALLKK